MEGSKQIELSPEEMKQIQGGDWLADWIADMLCVCNTRTRSVRWETRQRELDRRN